MGLNRAAALVFAALFVAACGGSGETTAKSTSAADGLQLKTVSGTPGTYLADGSGRALYLWMADGAGKSSCTGACAQEWPPLTAKGRPSAGSGVTAGELSTVKRSDGAAQVTYKGHPLYYFAGDSRSDKTAGQGLDDFGAKWWLVAPAGTAITGSAPAGSSSGGGW
jgi:predicted lipoprotein with Yx(FWY)xxD motif